MQSPRHVVQSLRGRSQSFCHHHRSELYINSWEVISQARLKEERRADNPQCAALMSQGLACYSKGAELASSSETDVHLFWHFLSTLTQKTHDTHDSPHFLSAGCLTKPLHFSSLWYLKLLSTQCEGRQKSYLGKTKVIKNHQYLPSGKPNAKIVSFSPFFWGGFLKFIRESQCIHPSTFLIKQKAKYGCQESCTVKQMQSSC